MILALESLVLNERFMVFIVDNIADHQSLNTVGLEKGQERNGEDGSHSLF
jgi:hypothetical protein